MRRVAVVRRGGAPSAITAFPFIVRVRFERVLVMTESQETAASPPDAARATKDRARHSDKSRNKTR